MMQTPKLARLFAALGLVGAIAAAPALAHETDQFAVPTGREMADVGPYLNDLFVDRLQGAVDSVNAQIRRATEEPEKLRTAASGHGPNKRKQAARRIDPEAVVAAAHSPEGIAEATWRSFGSAVDLIERVNVDLHSKEMIEKHAPALPAYKATADGTSVYSGLYLVVDPRTAFRTFHATSFKAFGSHMGADKVGHFTDMGYHYFKEYRKQVAAGKSVDEAMRHATKWGTSGTFSEKGLLGYMTAGAYSNADLASNYVGMLFYRNLTEPVYLDGELRQPMLERDGRYWKVADHVKNDPAFMDRFVSDHYDEALNPSLFEPTVRGTLRKKVSQRMPDLLAWYSDRSGDEDPAAFFEGYVNWLSTYHGHEYGHSKRFDDLVGLWNTPYEVPKRGPATASRSE